VSAPRDAVVAEGEARADLAEALLGAGVELWVWSPGTATCVVHGAPITPLARGRTHDLAALLAEVVADDRRALERALLEVGTVGELDVRFRLVAGTTATSARWLRLRGIGRAHV